MRKNASIGTSTFGCGATSMRTTADSTFGGGENAPGATFITIRASP